MLNDRSGPEHDRQSLGQKTPDASNSESTGPIRFSVLCPNGSVVRIPAMLRSMHEEVCVVPPDFIRKLLGAEVAMEASAVAWGLF